MTPSPTQRAVSEFLGTAFLLATVIGSGIMAQRLAGGNGALALLCNTLPTGAILTVLILIFGPISGAHFNPAVTLAFTLRGQLDWAVACTYIVMQICGAVVGVWAAHIMFELPVWQFATTVRTGPGQWFAEAVATFGLLLTIFGCIARAPSATAYAVGLYYNSSLLVHCFNIICKSGSDDCSRLVRHFCWHCSWGSGWIYHRSIGWCHCCNDPRALAMDREETGINIFD